MKSNRKYGTVEFRNENNQLHNEDGPALILSSGSKFWFINNKRHRIDGPAVEYYNGAKSYYYQDELIVVKTDEEFQRFIKLKAFW